MNDDAAAAVFNPLMGIGTYSTTSNNMKFLHWPQMGGDWAGPQPAQEPSRCTKRNSPPINGQCTKNTILLLCGFNVSFKGLTLSVRENVLRVMP